jgi:hypothetical protein
MNNQIDVSVETSADETLTALSALRDRLMQKVDKHVAPSGIFHWSAFQPYFIARLNGASESPPIDQPQFCDLYNELKQGALPFAPPMASLEELETRAEIHRAGGVIPIAIAHFDYTTVRRRYLTAMVRHAKEGTPFDVPPGAPSADQLREAVDTRQAFFAAPLLKQEFIGFAPAPIKHFGLEVRFALPADCYLSNVGAALSNIEVDLDDGLGWRPAPHGSEVAAHYAAPGARQVFLRAQAGVAQLAASFHLEVSASKAPTPDETWNLKSPLPPIDGVTPTGIAWVFRGKGNRKLAAPMLIAEGFPGGYPLDFLWDLLNKENVAEQMLAAGRDIVIVGFHQGTFYMEANAGVVIDAIQTSAEQVRSGGGTPRLAVGGASMGGVVARYALAYMEANDMPHFTSKYFSIDSPHNGAFVPYSNQLFAYFYQSRGGNVEKAAKLLRTEASRELLLQWWDESDATLHVPNALRTRFMDKLHRVGWYPKQPEKYGVADGSGLGYSNNTRDGAQALYWSSPCAGVDMYTAPGLGGESDRLIARLCLGSATWTNFRMKDGVVLPDSESAPGGTSPTYQAVAQGLRDNGYNPNLFFGDSCFIPTVSALAMDKLYPDNNAALGTDVAGLFEVDKPGGTWLDKYTFSQSNQQHVAIDANLAGWIFGNLNDKTVFVVNASQEVFSLPDGAAYPLDGGARDIGVCSDGTVWALSNKPRAGGYIPYWLDRGSKTWTAFTGPAGGISITGRPWHGMAYITTDKGAIQALTKEQKAFDVKCAYQARDIAINNNFAWIVTSNERSGGFAPASLYRGMPDQPWVELAAPAAATRIAILPNGDAMAVDGNGDVCSFDTRGKRTPYPGVKAQDIGVAGDGTVWVISDKARPGGVVPCWLDWGSKTWHEMPAPAAALKIAAL